MRLVIDLQGAQGGSRGRGIGRFSRELALAMVREPGAHEPIILLNEAMPDTAETLSDAFAALLPRENIRSWHGLSDCSYFQGSTERRRASEQIRAQVLAGLDPDLVHVASVVEGGGDDVISGWPTSHRRLPVVATFYDAIPLMWRSTYLTQPKHLNWYFRQLHELRHCTALLSISESSRKEAIDHLNRDPLDVFNILAGFDSKMFRPVNVDLVAQAVLLARYQLRKGFLLFVGAGDPRKNESGLLQAYAKLPAALRAKHQLVIVGSWNPVGLSKEAERLGVQNGDFVLLTRVPDLDLPSLYSICYCFVLPSKHEGFGLPALEAMACGAPVIASNSTSLPEVVGLSEALFDPSQPDDIADRLLQVLTQEDFRTRLIEHGLVQAKQFSWAACAKRAWEALDAVHRNHPACQKTRPYSSAVAVRKPSLAFVGPLPPDASGIADYARDLLPNLDKYYEVTIVTVSGLVDDLTLSAVFPVLDEAAFAEIAHRFDRIVYQVGNSEFHVGIVNTLLPLYPGVVVLHDSFIGNIPLNAFRLNGDINELARALFASDGWPAIRALTRDGVLTAVAQFPYVMPVFRHALGVLQHSAYARGIVAEHAGCEAADMVRLVPFARARWLSHGTLAARAALALPIDVPLTCSFGIAAASKRPLDVLEAWNAAFATNPAALLAFVGHGSVEIVLALRSRAIELGLGERVIQTGRVDETTYRLWLDAADIAVQLRTGSRGESSAAIADCMAVGLPIIANAHGSTAELPTHTLVLLPDLATASEIGLALATLWADPARRNAISASATDHVRKTMSPAVAALAYYDAIEHFYAYGKAAQGKEALPVVPADDMPNAARALATSFPLPGPRRLLLNISHMSRDDVGTGIQRMIGEIGQRLLTSPDPSFIADMVRLDGATLRYARSFSAQMLEVSSYGLLDSPVLAKSGDTLVLMDNYGTITRAESAELRRQQRLGARIIVVIYDLRPLQRPDWSPSDTAPLPQNWLFESLRMADAALCISPAVAEDLTAWLSAGADDGTFVRNRPLDIGWFHLGSDFGPVMKEEAKSVVVDMALQAAGQPSSFLMVDTTEPEIREKSLLSWDDTVTEFLRPLQFGEWQIRWLPSGQRNREL